MDQQAMQTLAQWVQQSDNIVFFGGAGVSTESNIPDFRSADGLYNQHYNVPPETMLSHHYFVQHPEEFFRFYREKMICLSARPNPAHLKLAQWEREGKLRAVITQNIDGLHQMAGSERVIELHGSVHRNICQRCGKVYDAQWIMQTQGVPHCSCGGMVKPDVVLYEEALNGQDIEDAVAAIEQADVLIVGGTSLAVYPAAGLIRYYRGHKLALINRDPTPYDQQADVRLNGNIGQIMQQL